MASQTNQLLLLTAAYALAAIAVADIKYLTIKKIGESNVDYRNQPRVVVVNSKDGDPTKAESGDITTLGSTSTSSRVGVSDGRWFKLFLGDKLLGTAQMPSDYNNEIKVTKTGGVTLGDTFSEAAKKAFGNSNS